MNRQKDAWREAKRRCRLTEEEVRMAKELGFQPKSLIRNIPSPSQQWKAPVSEWVRSLYAQKIGSRKPNVIAMPASSAAPSFKPGEERRIRENPWPDNPEIADPPPVELHDECSDDDWDDF